MGQQGSQGRVLKERAPLVRALAQLHGQLFLVFLLGTAEDFGTSRLIVSPTVSSQYFCCPLFGGKETDWEGLHDLSKAT